MIKIKNYYQSSLLSQFKHIEHRFYTKNGGVSQGDFESLNVSFFTQDNEENILKNRNIIQKDLGCINPVSTLKQNHSSDVFVLSNILPVSDMKNILGDGLITNHVDLPIGVFTADCIPVLFVESNYNIIASVHCGWKGLYNGILQNTIAKINSLTFHHSNIYVAMGPSIGGVSYEVDDKFYNDHIQKYPQSIACFMESQSGHFLYDIKQFATLMLLDSGIKHDQIDDLNLDTYDLKNEFFSHRRTTYAGKIHRGLQLSSIFIKHT